MLTVFDKVLLIFTGLFFTSIGLHLLALNDLTFGGTAGIASILTFSTEMSWGLAFFIVNLPFFIISLQKLGKWFTIYSLLSITVITILSEALVGIMITGLPSIVSAVVSGLFIGVGVTMVLNNGSSLGGIHILALYLDQKMGINRGLTIFGSDVLIVLGTVIMVGWSQALISILCILIASTIIGRYKKSPIKEREEDQVSVSMSESSYSQK